ncbi:HDIG domain-containing protein [Methylobacterium sp. UNC378MF]|uniref:HD-GYP domain-containing protein n=1 Tax=Methylobacterium sp. UNC378MF TaxID=1502748 RepID=UPI00088B4C1D|nr:HD domain-containing protein [Methylobacterium sp. UNC378MF]SDA18918.1 HDIG domain-containing protein [Methylobacterium sp. UNC378MF]
MALGAASRFSDGPFVLLVSDRPSERSALERAIALVMNCRAIPPGVPLPSARPHLVILDLPPADTAKLQSALARHGSPVPRLVLVRGEPMPGARYLRQLPAASPRQLVLANVFAMIEEASRAAEARQRRLLDCVSGATAVVAEIFDSAALGARLQRADADRGTELVLAAVSEVGIADWLAEVWRHEIGVYQHTLGVAGHAATFGSQIGLSQTDLTLLVRSALLHDIGKARIPVEILNKPGPLNAEELRLMQRHPDIGAHLLRAHGDFEDAVIDVVRHHHERLDGKGYPDRLSGPAIADLVRIVTICDVFSALTERRTYRQPATPAEALSIMAGSTGHMDPDLLRAFAPSMLKGSALAA